MITRSKSVNVPITLIRKKRIFKRCDSREVKLKTVSSKLLNDPNNSKNATNRVKKMTGSSIPVAPFSKKDPASWFRQLEATFVINEITDDDIRYAHLQARLDPELLSSISEFFKVPPTENKYESLKDKLTSRYTDSRDNQVLQLLEGLSLGDRKPSELLSEIQRLAANDIAENVIRAMFIKKLPENLMGILAGSNEPIGSLGLLADRIHNFTSNISIAAASTGQPSIAAIRQVDPNTQLLNILVESVSKLTMKIAELESRPPCSGHSSRYQQRSPSRNQHSPSRNRSPYRPRDESRQRSKVPEGLEVCYYHYTFGKNAKKCKQLEDGRDCLMKSVN